MAQNSFRPPIPTKQHRIGSAAALTGGFAVAATLLASLLAGGRIGLPEMTAAIAIYSLIAALVRLYHGSAPFGLANTVTALRAGLVAVLPALILAADRFDAM